MLILDHHRVKCEAQVKTWEDHGMQFVPFVSPNTRPRTQQITTIVWHWTGGEGDGKRVYKTLSDRSLGVEFCIDRDGIIWQYCDPSDTDARDCGSYWDRFSVGVEMVNYGMRWPYSKPWNLLGAPRLGRDRNLIETHLRGRRIFVADFYQEQIAAADALADALRSVYHIPKMMLLNNKGFVLDRPVTAAERAGWIGGEIGHLQITSGSKADPGIPFLEHRSIDIGF